ncbi:MAG TPA: ribbon-helix-helix protein, CopG family [Candidatus Binataceae bacterium]|nr:ribbon-helix-helix protein, CopG family [Candidatus Binataceae bacterium]
MLSGAHQRTEFPLIGYCVVELITKEYGRTILDMASIRIKSTYSLDVETVRKLDSLAAQWHVPKSEALRRAIDLAVSDQATRDDSPLRALDELQKNLKMRLGRQQIESWAAETRRERVKSSARREWHKL